MPSRQPSSGWVVSCESRRSNAPTNRRRPALVSEVPICAVTKSPAETSPVSAHSAWFHMT